MIRPFTWSAVVFALALLPLTAFGQGKNNNKITHLETSAQDYAMLAKMPGIAAKILEVDPAGKSVTVEVEFPVVSFKGGKPPNIRVSNNYRPNYNRNYNRGYRGGYHGGRGRGNPNAAAMRMMQQQMRQQQQMAQNMMRQQMQQMKQMAAAQKQLQNSLEVHVMSKDFAVPLASDIHVARKDLPFQYDDKGNIKKHTAEEMKALKDARLPGFKASLEELQPGQIVYLYISKQPGVKTAKSGEKTAEKASSENKGKTDVKTKEDPLAALLGNGNAPGKNDAPPKEDIKPQAANKAAGADPLAAILGTGNSAGEPSRTPVVVGSHGPQIHGILILADVDLSSVQPANTGKKNKK